MFGLGLWEIAVIFVVGLLVLGPEKLPKVARQLGRGVRELKRAATEFQRSLNSEVDGLEAEVREASRLDRVDKIAAADRVEREITSSKEIDSPPPREAAADDATSPENGGHGV